MKSPKEYLDSYRLIGMSGLLSNMIEEIQKDAYNQAIEDAANNAKVPIHAPMTIDKNSILKLKIK